MQKLVDDFTKRNVGTLRLEFFGLSGDVSSIKIKSVSLKKDKKISSIITHLKNKLNKQEGINLNDSQILSELFYCSSSIS